MVPLRMSSSCANRAGDDQRPRLKQGTVTVSGSHDNTSESGCIARPDREWRPPRVLVCSWSGLCSSPSSPRRRILMHLSHHGSSLVLLGHSPMFLDPNGAESLQRVRTRQAGEHEQRHTHTHTQTHQPRGTQTSNMKIFDCSRSINVSLLSAKPMASFVDTVDQMTSSRRSRRRLWPRVPPIA